MHIIRRAAKILSRRVGDDVVAVDLKTKEAHTLGPAASAVWDACERDATMEELVGRTGLCADEVGEAVDALADAGLVGYARPSVTRLSRRALLAGGASGGAVLVASIALPTAAFAASVPPGHTKSGSGGSTSGGSFGSGDPGSGGTGATTSTASATAGGSDPAGATTSAATAPNGQGTLAYTGAPVAKEVATGAALVVAGSVIAAAATKKKEDPKVNGSSAL